MKKLTNTDVTTYIRRLVKSHGIDIVIWDAHNTGLLGLRGKKETALIFDLLSSLRTVATTGVLPVFTEDLAESAKKAVKTKKKVPSP